MSSENLYNLDYNLLLPKGVLLRVFIGKTAFLFALMHPSPISVIFQQIEFDRDKVVPNPLKIISQRKKYKNGSLRTRAVHIMPM